MDQVSDFFRETEIKATRKPHYCIGCQLTIPAGSEAIYCAGKFDGQIDTGHYHRECREAEVAWNHEADTWGEDWNPLFSIRDDDESETWMAWLAQHHPIAAGRLAP